MRHTLIRPAVAGSALALAATACGGGGGTRPAATPAAAERAATVAVVRLAFDPVELTVPAGTTVTWRSDEPITHTVTSGKPTGIDPATGLRSGADADGAFDGPLDTTGATYSFLFPDPGTYSYYCEIHRGMNARVVVT